MRQFKNAAFIPDSKVEIMMVADDEINFTIIGEKDNHWVNYDRGLWRCSCEDYVYAKDKQLGSYTCKHIIKCIQYLDKHKDDLEGYYG